MPPFPIHPDSTTIFHRSILPQNRDQSLQTPRLRSRSLIHDPHSKYETQNWPHTGIPSILLFAIFTILLLRPKDGVSFVHRLLELGSYFQGAEKSKIERQYQSKIERKSRGLKSRFSSFETTIFSLASTLQWSPT